MSFSGKFTPLQLNVYASFNGVAARTDNPNGDPEGIDIGPTVSTYQGTWSSSGTYIPGTLITGTPLLTLYNAIQTAYTKLVATPTQANVNIYRRLITIAKDVCPALGNSRPSTFEKTYAGSGSWDSATGNQLSGSYPPKNYPRVNAYSYVHQLSANRAWLYSWPAKSYTTGGHSQISSWQKTTDSYKAILEPTSTDGLNSITLNATTYNNEYDEYFKHGFIGTIAKQAYYEMWRGTGFNRFNLFCDAFQRAYSLKQTKNKLIASLANSKTFMSGTFSSMEDLTSSNISGVSMAYLKFGEDLIKSGRVIDLSRIEKFGLPSVLLKAMFSNKCNLQGALGLALTLYGGIVDVPNLLDDNYVPTQEEEVKIYTAFSYITGDDLSEILFCLNCKTTGISTLTDLLDLSKLLPQSYTTLTIPEYNLDRNITNSAKIYNFIFSGSGANPQIAHWGDYLTGILPDSLARTNGAFSMTMRQIKFIKNMDIEKFSQIVANLELTTKDLPLVTTTNGAAANMSLVDNMLDTIALGSGAEGAYKMADFFGAAAGYPYVDYYYAQASSHITSLASADLKAIYTAINTAATNNDWATLSTKITEANTEIERIKTNNTRAVDQLNYIWDKIGKQMTIEQRAQPYVIDTPQTLVENVPDSVESFVSQIETYAVDNADGQSARILALLADSRYVGGQSLIAALREARNATRLIKTDGELQNEIDDYLDSCAASAKATVVNGVITQVAINTSGAGYSAANPPTVKVFPVNVDQQALFTPVISTVGDGSVTSIVVTNGGKGYNQDTVSVVIEPPPQCQYANDETQSLVDTIWSLLVEPELVADTSTQLDVKEAIAQVIHCNCDCWVE